MWKEHILIKKIEIINEGIPVIEKGKLRIKSTLI